MAIGYSLALDDNNWDLELDEFGNIATKQGDDAITQDVSCALRLFYGEAYFYPQKGVPYFSFALGKIPNEAIVRSEVTAAAKAVRGVIDANMASYEITNNNRSLNLSLNCLTQNGNTVQVQKKLSTSKEQ